MIRQSLAAMGFVTGRKWFWSRAYSPTPQTATEMRAYCRVWGIPVHGKVLADREYRTTPHPQSYGAHLPLLGIRTTRLRGQLEAFTPMGDG